MKKVAFITTQFLSENSKSGGIGNYIFKMARALQARGVAVDVIVTSDEKSETIQFEGITVHRVSCKSRCQDFLKKFRGKPKISTIAHLLSDMMVARQLSNVFMKLNGEREYDIVQITNHNFPGLFIRKMPDCKVVYRLSSNRLLYDRAEGIRISPLTKVRNRIEIFCLKRADLVYAPSRFLADYINENYGIDVKVVHPPADIGGHDVDPFTTGLPGKYLLHFGTLSKRKGTDLVVEALVEAWKKEPELRMVFVGRLQSSLDEAEIYRKISANADRVQFIDPVKKAHMYDIIRKSAAAVLPSRADNIPNTVTESVSLGIPVIGTANSSIEEVIQHGKNGLLVPNGDSKALSEAMIQIWNGKVVRRRKDSPAMPESFEPDHAVDNFLSTVG